MGPEENVHVSRDHADLECMSALLPRDATEKPTQKPG